MGIISQGERSEGDRGSPQAPPSAADALDPVRRGMLHC